MDILSIVASLLFVAVVLHAVRIVYEDRIYYYKGTSSLISSIISGLIFLTILMAMQRLLEIHGEKTTKIIIICGSIGAVILAKIIQNRMFGTTEIK